MKTEVLGGRMCGELSGNTYDSHLDFQKARENRSFQTGAVKLRLRGRFSWVKIDQKNPGKFLRTQETLYFSKMQELRIAEQAHCIYIDEKEKKWKVGSN